MDRIEKILLKRTNPNTNWIKVFTENDLNDLETYLYEEYLKIKSITKLSRKYHINPPNISKIIKKKQGFVTNFHNELKFDNSVFDLIDSEEKAYWLGFIFADGYVGDNNSFELSLALKDKGHLEKFNKFINFNKLHEDSFRCRVCLRDKHFIDNLKKLGCIPRKSLILTFPKDSIFKNKSIVRDFIRGYFDGDGCISKETTSFCAVELLGTREFLEHVCNIYDIDNNRLRKDKRHKNNTWHIRFKVKEQVIFLNSIYFNSTIYLDRKYDKYLNLIKRRKILDNNE